MNAKVIGEKLKDLRGDRKRLVAAKDLGISKSALAMYENGERTPRDEIKIKIAKYYGISVQEIFFSDPEHYMCTNQVASDDRKVQSTENLQQTGT